MTDRGRLIQEPQRYKEFATWSDCIGAVCMLAGGMLLLGRGNLAGLILLAGSAVLWWLGVNTIIRRWKLDIYIAGIHGEQRGAEMLLRGIPQERD